MELNKVIVTFFIMISSVVAITEIDLPEISTKQSISNLRYISRDGKLTYYQRRSGSLLLSTNYEVDEILKGPIGTQYTVTSSSARKYTLIEQSINFHTYLSIRKLNKIYYSKLGKKTKSYIGEGVDARLHENDKWISYYNPYTNKLSFNNLVNPSANFHVILRNKKNPYFIPQRRFISKNKVLYTDINKEGLTGLISFNRQDSKSKLLQKSDNESMRYELCTNDQHLFIGAFSSDIKSPYSSITSYSKKDLNLGKGKIYYDNNKNDIGQIICNNKDSIIYFIKDMSKEYGSTGYEVAQLNLKTKKIDILSSLKWVNSIVNMDGRLLLPFRGTYYVLTGESNSSSKDNLSKKENEDGGLTK